VRGDRAPGVGRRPFPPRTPQVRRPGGQGGLRGAIRGKGGVGSAGRRSRGGQAEAARSSGRGRQAEAGGRSARQLRPGAGLVCGSTLGLVRGATAVPIARPAAAASPGRSTWPAAAVPPASVRPRSRSPPAAPRWAALPAWSAVLGRDVGEVAGGPVAEHGPAPATQPAASLGRLTAHFSRPRRAAASSSPAVSGSGSAVVSRRIVARARARDRP